MTAAADEARALLAVIQLDFIASRPLPKTFRKGQRVEDFLYGPGTVVRKQKRDYWVQLDSGSLELIGGGDLKRL